MEIIPVTPSYLELCNINEILQHMFGQKKKKRKKKLLCVGTSSCTFANFIKCNNTCDILVASATKPVQKGPRAANPFLLELNPIERGSKDENGSPIP